MSIQENKDIVKQFFECFSEVDLEGALTVTSSDVVWRVMGSEGGLPMSGKRDRKEIGELIEAVKAGFPDGMTLTPTDWTCEGDRVAVEMESNAVKANGAVYNNFYHFALIVRDGMIVSIKEYLDTLHVKRVFIDDN
ncbi:MAG: nuclear transport factor 2 family protein [Planctomycetota bacterium]